jgi:hypothetical protein
LIPETPLTTPLPGIRVLEFSHAVMGEAGFTADEIADPMRTGVIAARDGESSWCGYR